MNIEPRQFFRGTLLALAVAALAGCADRGGIEGRSQVREPGSFGLSDPAAPASAASGDAPQAQAVANAWWQAYGDPQLDELIRRAVKDSPTLKMAQARVRQALASTRLAESANQPQVLLDVEESRQLFSANTIYPPPFGGSIFNGDTVQLEASWEVDIFGKNRAAVEAAVGNTRAAELDAIAAKITLESAVTRSYLKLRALGSQLEVAQRTLQQREELFNLVRQRLGAGLDSKVELRQAEGALPEARRQMEALQEQVSLARHALAALLGQPGEEPLAQLPTLAGLQGPATPTALPADLIGRRPDILAARWRVEAAESEVASARAQFYPNVNLVAFAGYSSFGLDSLWKNSSQQWGIGPAVTLPLFTGGRLRANLRGKTAEQDRLIESYNATVIDAVHEVLDQVSSLQSIGKQQVLQQRAQDAVENAYELARQRYEGGLGSYLQVLSAETAVLDQRRLAVDLQARLLDTQVALVKALGGGFQADAKSLNTER